LQLCALDHTSAIFQTIFQKMQASGAESWMIPKTVKMDGKLLQGPHGF
jgi:hypothetical protein